MSRFVAFDVETPNCKNYRMSAIGITVIENKSVVNEFYSLVNPETYFDSFNIRLTGINEELVAHSPTFRDLWPQIEPVMSSGLLVAHSAAFDLRVLRYCLRDYGISWKRRVSYLCTVKIGRCVLPNISHKLNAMCDYYGIALNHHHAGSDSRACGEILLRYMKDGVDVRQFIKRYELIR